MHVKVIGRGEGGLDRKRCEVQAYLTREETVIEGNNQFGKNGWVLTENGEKQAGEWRPWVFQDFLVDCR